MTVITNPHFTEVVQGIEDELAYALLAAKEMKLVTHYDGRYGSSSPSRLRDLPSPDDLSPDGV